MGVRLLGLVLSDGCDERRCLVLNARRSAYAATVHLRTNRLQTRERIRVGRGLGALPQHPPRVENGMCGTRAARSTLISVMPRLEKRGSESARDARICRT